MKYLKSFESVESDYNKIEFIPLELREEIITRFIWDKEVEEFCYGRIKKYQIFSWEKFDMMKNDEYLEKMKNELIGKMVDFTKFNYGEYIKTHIENWIIIDITYNSRGILIFENDRGNTAAVDEREIVSIYKREQKKFNPLDPFGEEF